MRISLGSDPSSNTPTSRLWPRRLLIGFNIFLVVILVGGVTAFGYTKWRFDQVGKIDLGSVLKGDAGEAMNVLVVGSDDRAELEPGQTQEFGTAEEVGPVHSDTIMIMRVDPETERAAILSLPRDLWVDVYGPDGDNKGKAKINSAIQGGPDQLITTVSENFGIPIEHYMQIDFDGFRDIVSAVGGVPVRFDSPVRDFKAGLDIDEAGCRVLSGDEALSYVRSRNYETFESGRWRTDPRADLSRIDRQQDFIRRVLGTAISKGARNPVTLNSLISAGVRNVQLDEGFSLGDMTKLARRFQSLDPNDVEMMTLPNTVSDVTQGGESVSVLLVKQPDARQTIDRFLNGPPDLSEEEVIPPSSISVRVLNGTGAAGQASEVAGGLQGLGFVVSGKGDARSSGNSTTTIRYGAGQQDKARSLARFVRGDARLVEDKTIRGSDVVLVTGANFGGVGEPGSAPPAPSTTAAPTQATPAPEEPAC